jgi:hypothetical protein
VFECRDWPYGSDTIAVFWRALHGKRTALFFLQRVGSSQRARPGANLKENEMLKKTIATALLFTGLTLGPAIAEPHGGVGAPGPGISGGAPHGPIGGGGAPAFRSAPPVGAGPRIHSDAGPTRVYGWRGGEEHHHEFHHHRRGVGGVFVDGGYYDDGYSYGGCGWLYRRAVSTGSAYWWHRYEECAY